MTEPDEAVTLDPPASSWPGVIGVIGIVLGALTLFDKAGDLLVLTLTEADWVRWFGREVAGLVVQVMPPTWWIVTVGLGWIAMSILLINGSLRLRRRRQSGVALCRWWSGLAIVWIVVDVSLGLWWFRRLTEETSIMPPDGWQGAAVLGMLVLLLVLLSYPVFLLVWFGRPAVRAEYGGWPE